MSPDAARLAFVTPGPASRLMVLDISTNHLAVDELVDSSTYPIWSSDSNQLFWVTNSYGEASTIVGRVDVDSGVSESVRLPFGGTLSAVAVDRADAGSFLPTELAADPDSCPPPNIQPSNRTAACGFRVTSRPAS
jgi:hypothetical protein